MGFVMFMTVLMVPKWLILLQGTIFAAAISSHEWRPFWILGSLMKSKLFVRSLSIFITFRTYNYSQYFKTVIYGI